MREAGAPLCECGCGTPTRQQDRTSTKHGVRAGDYARFVAGHSSSRRGPLDRYVVSESGCWEWTGYRTHQGYGKVHVGGEKTSAHRAMWESLYGELPRDIHVDHLCCNPPCINPAHLEPVTPAENTRRGQERLGIGAYATHCKSGHEFTSKNTYNHPNGARSCRTCRNLRSTEFRRRMAAT